MKSKRAIENNVTLAACEMSLPDRCTRVSLVESMRERSNCRRKKIRK